MKKEKLTKFILALEIAAIILLHMAKVSDAGFMKYVQLKNKTITPTLQVHP